MLAMSTVSITTRNGCAGLSRRDYPERCFKEWLSFAVRYSANSLSFSSLLFSLSYLLSLSYTVLHNWRLFTYASFELHMDSSQPLLFWGRYHFVLESSIILYPSVALDDFTL